jgi:hypothetical protein
MSGLEQAVWLRVASGVESLSEAGVRVWRDPARARKALGELLGVFPATHVQVDLAALLRGEAEPSWAALLARDGPWGELLNELVLALGSALRPPAVWGLGLPSPKVVAASLGDESERGVVKAGLQLASFLQVVRAAPIGFVAVDVGILPASADRRAINPIFRNGEMYGWRRAVCVEGLESLPTPRPDGEIALAQTDDLPALCSLWERGELVGGGLGARFWAGEPFERTAPPRFLLYGSVPEAVAPRAIVEAGRQLRAWTG